MRQARLLLAAVVLLAGCDTAPIKEIRGLIQGHKGEPELAAGIRAYENGSYNESARQLQSALDAGLARSDQVQAHKYLAFIHCASGRERPCREEFRKALAVDPEFELAPAEAGHPTWGPVFRSVKVKR
jgi:Tfp pilus assembly protein PilF